MKVIIFIAVCVALVASATADVVVAPKTYEGLRFLGAVVRDSGVGAGAGAAIQTGPGVQAVKFYYTSFERADWATAFDGCNRLTLGDGTMVKIESSEQDRAVHNLLRAADVAWKGELVWTSGVSNRVGAWFWDSPAIAIPFGTYTNFAATVNPNTPSSYLAFSSVNEREYEWVPRRTGTEKLYYVCEV